jgi:hypothetical protein
LNFTLMTKVQRAAVALRVIGLHKLTEKGVEVVGVNGDSVLTHSLFEKAQLTAVARAFGV